jgi:hypothetical protein
MIKEWVVVDFAENDVECRFERIFIKKDGKRTEKSKGGMEEDQYMKNDSNY